MTMRMRNTKWLCNPGKQSKVRQIFSHMQPNYHSESGSKKKICAPSSFVMQINKVPFKLSTFASLQKMESN